MIDFTKDEQLIAEAILEGRKIQEYLWQELSLLKKPYNRDAYVSIFSKRVLKIANLNMENPNHKVELRKRILPQAALSILALLVIDND